MKCRDVLFQVHLVCYEENLVVKIRYVVFVMMRYIS